MDLNSNYWEKRYLENTTTWDLGEIAPPIKAYFDHLRDKNLRILIPGCGRGYEAEYLYKNGFSAVHILDFAKEPLVDFKKRVPGFPDGHIHQCDFFDFEGSFDRVIEQTMFCAIDPGLRRKYAQKATDLLLPNGKLVGLFFDRYFEGGPPFGGDKKQYVNCFTPFFTQIQMTACYNSIGPRQGSELFAVMSK
jgi:methyl halide transferase